MTGRTNRSPARPEHGAGLRIVIQNGEYWMLNKGDLAMLDVTVRRLRERWPHARIGVMTSAPLLLSCYHPDVDPILAVGRGGWPSRRLVATIAAVAGPRICGPVTDVWLSAQHRPRHFLRRVRNAFKSQLRKLSVDHRANFPVTAEQFSAESDIPDAVRDAALVVAMGGGYLADVDRGQTQRTLAMLDRAARAGIPTAMVGQGLGPLESGDLLAMAERVLPRVDFISLRENRRGPKLLADLGVPEERVVVTGDDAIELAAGVRRAELGSGIGACLRIADYSPVAAQTRTAVARALQEVAGEVGAPLLPLIISEFRSEDRRSTLPLVAGFPNVVPPLGRYVGPVEVATAVSNCRVLVTGAYHLAVFALSQGIPVVGLSASRYYDDKLLGLAEMFGRGLTLVRLDEPGLQGRLAAAIRTAWLTAEQVRGPLRASADEQIAASRAAFDRVFAMVDGGVEGR